MQLDRMDRMNSKLNGKVYQIAAAALLILTLYLPTIDSGFLTDDFLDAQTEPGDAHLAFSSMMSSGYRPLMSYSWALDNLIWGQRLQWGWHLTNVLILFLALYSIQRFLTVFIKSRSAVLAGMMLFALCLPVALSVGKVVWRTSLLPLIPLLWSMVLVARYEKNPRFIKLAGASVLFFTSLLLKEIALAAAPVLGFVAWAVTEDEKGVKAFFRGVLVGVVPTAAYILLRVLTVGLVTGYADSTIFGTLMLKNLFLLSSMIWSPWLESIPARVLVPVQLLFIYFMPCSTRRKVLAGMLPFFLLITASNLPPRADYAAAAAISAAMVLATYAEAFLRRIEFRILYLVLIGAIFLRSFDELKILHTASEIVDSQTDRMAMISEELPGTGPVFFSGVTGSFAGYGTFWEEEYMQPLLYNGENPSHFITGTNRMWEQLITHRDGHLVFLHENSYQAFDVSIDMHCAFSDTSVSFTGAVLSDCLSSYPSCRAYGQAQPIFLVTALAPDSLIEITPFIRGDSSYFNLASVPEWLADEGNSALVSRQFVELTFTSRNYALEEAADRLSGKQRVEHLQ